MTRYLIVCSIATLMLGVCPVHAQQDVPPAFALHPDQEVRVRGVSSRAAASTEARSVLAASLATIFHDAEVCCEKNSAPENGVEAPMLYHCRM
jgi:hypothetical protein